MLEFRSNNATHRPVLDALALIKRHADARLTYYPATEAVPTHKALLGDWTPLVFQDTSRGRRRVIRTVYEICTFQALRERLRCKEIWVVGADKWRNPDEDLPADFDGRRVEHYAALRKPIDASEFIDQLRHEMRIELDALQVALPKLAWLDIRDRGNQGAIKLTDFDAAPEPRNLRRLKNHVRTRWGTVPLIDMLKEAVLRTGCLSGVTAAAGRGDLPPQVLAERLLLAIYAYGTNTGIRSVAGNAVHGHGEDDIRYVRRRYLTAEVARAIAIEIANATFAARSHTVWGAGSTAVASDSTHFGAFDQNIFTPMALPLRRPRRAHLLARRTQIDGHPLAADRLHRIRSRRDGRRRDPARHHHAGRRQLRRLPGPVRDRVRVDPAARIRPAAPHQTDQQDPAVPAAHRRTRRLPPAGAGHDEPGHPMGHHRRAVRPDDQIRHRDPNRHRLHRGDPAPIHQGQRDPPHLPGDDRGRPRAENHLASPATCANETCNARSTKD